MRTARKPQVLTPQATTRTTPARPRPCRRGVGWGGACDGALGRSARFPCYTGCISSRRIATAPTRQHQLQAPPGEIELPPHVAQPCGGGGSLSRERQRAHSTSPTLILRPPWCVFADPTLPNLPPSSHLATHSPSQWTWHWHAGCLRRLPHCPLHPGCEKPQCGPASQCLTAHRRIAWHPGTPSEKPCFTKTSLLSIVR